MKNMKKVLISLLACLCVGTAACGFAACKDDEKAGTGTGTGGLGGLGGLGGNGGNNTDDGNTDDGNDGATAQVMVIFDAGHGEFANESDAVQVVNANSTLTMPTPTRDGYVLNGWQLANGTKWDATQKVTTNVTLYAIWKKDVQEYDVRFNLNYDGAEVVTLSTEEGKVTYIPEREGYVFKGWWEGSDLSTKFNTNNLVTESGLELYAEWVEEDKASAYLSAPVITVSGETFTWDEVEGASSYSIVVYYNSSQVNSTTEYDTSWEFYGGGYGYGVYTVQIRANGDGVNKVNSQYNSVSYRYKMLDSVTGIALDPFTSLLTWNGVENADYYRLYIDGYEASSYLDSTKYDMSNYTAGLYSVVIYAYDDYSEYQYSSSSTAYVSKLKLNTPSSLYCSFDLEDNEYTFSWDSVSSADSYELTLNGETYTTYDRSYTINGDSIAWNEDNQVLYSVKAKNSNNNYLKSDASYEYSYSMVDVYTISIDYETYAYYNAPVVSFNLNGGSGTVASQMVTKDNGLQYPSTIPTYSGYVFKGWYTEAACNNLYDFTSEVTGDMTLYAGWYYMGSSAYHAVNVQDETNSSFTSSSVYTSSKQYCYLTALTTDVYYLYYELSWGYSTYFSIYNITQGTYYTSSRSFSNYTYYNYYDFSVNKGDIIRIEFWRYSSSDYVNYYVTGAMPADGGVADYTYDVSTKETQENADVYYTADGYTAPTLTATAPANNYDFLGWYDENGGFITTEKTYTLYSVTGDMKYVAKWVKCYQAGSSFETAKTAELNTGYGVQIYSAGEWAYYKFTPTTTGNYYMYSTNLSGDSQGFLYGSNWEEPLANDDDANGNYNFKIEYTLNANETYYLKVGDLGGDNTCSFTFYITMAS